MCTTCQEFTRQMQLMNCTQDHKYYLLHGEISPQMTGCYEQTGRALWELCCYGLIDKIRPNVRGDWQSEF